MLLRYSTLHNVFLHVLTSQFGKFVSTLKAGWDSYCSLPIIIVKALLKGEINQCFLRHLACIIGYYKSSGSTSTLGYILGSQVEVIHIVLGQRLDHYTSRIRVNQVRNELLSLSWVSCLSQEISCIDLFIYGNNRYLWIIILSSSFFAYNFYHALQGRDLHSWDLHFYLGNT